MNFLRAVCSETLFVGTKVYSKTKVYELVESGGVSLLKVLETSDFKLDWGKYEAL